MDDFESQVRQRLQQRQERVQQAAAEAERRAGEAAEREAERTRRAREWSEKVASRFNETEKASGRALEYVAPQANAPGGAATHTLRWEGRRTPALNITISLGLKESAKWQFDPDAGQVSEGPFRIEQLDDLIYSFIDGVYHR